jgi:signal transduction histidine kinase
VDDTGIGIPKEKRELVFEDYVQVKEGQGGTGLGLGIVQSFVSSIFPAQIFHISDVFDDLIYHSCLMKLLNFT